jgi:hypothetical protein
MIIAEEGADKFVVEKYISDLLPDAVVASTFEGMTSL